LCPDFRNLLGDPPRKSHELFGSHTIPSQRYNVRHTGQTKAGFPQQDAFCNCPLPKGVVHPRRGSFKEIHPTSRAHFLANATQVKFDQERVDGFPPVVVRGTHTGTTTPLRERARDPHTTPCAPNPLATMRRGARNPHFGGRTRSLTRRGGNHHPSRPRTRWQQPHLPCGRPTHGAAHTSHQRQPGHTVGINPTRTRPHQLEPARSNHRRPNTTVHRRRRVQSQAARSSRAPLGRRTRGGGTPRKRRKTPLFITGGPLKYSATSDKVGPQTLSGGHIPYPRVPHVRPQ